ncbi:MAG: hypothetical protein K2W78_12120 [Xanthobacteraceae bacterium]|nr:hypothetical protein [Xanthobacteraceae bacterium]
MPKVNAEVSAAAKAETNKRIMVSSTDEPIKIKLTRTDDQIVSRNVAAAGIEAEPIKGVRAALYMSAKQHSRRKRRREEDVI